MPGAGTDKTKRWRAGPAPVVVLVEPQLGENIGAAARAMANFGLSRLRLVKPRQHWPNDKAVMMAAGADRILDDAVLYDRLEAAIADCAFVLATTARAHDQAKPVVGAAEAAAEMAQHVAAGETVAVVFGRERNGLENDEVALADRIVTLPVNPAFASLNLAQAVVIVAYEWFKRDTRRSLPFGMPQKSAPAPQATVARLLRRAGTRAGKGRVLPAARQARNHADQLAQHLHPDGADAAGHPDAARRDHGDRGGTQGPARGGVLDGEEAEMLRALLAEHGGGRVPKERGPVRGLARLLRRNPTDAERALWQALVNDRRFAGRGFKRQTPVGQHICDFVSFPLRLVIDVIPAAETETAAKARAEKRTWLAERDYRIVWK